MNPEINRGYRLIALLALMVTLLTACGVSNESQNETSSGSGTSGETIPEATPTLAPQSAFSIVSQLEKKLLMYPGTAIDNFNTNPLATEFINNSGAASVVVLGLNSDVYFSDNGLKTYLFLQSPSGADVMRMLGETDSQLASNLVQGNAIAFYGQLSIDQSNTLHNAGYRFDTEQVITDTGTTYQTTVSANNLPLVGFAFRPEDGTYDQAGGNFQALAYTVMNPTR